MLKIWSFLQWALPKLKSTHQLLDRNWKTAKIRKMGQIGHFFREDVYRIMYRLTWRCFEAFFSLKLKPFIIEILSVCIPIYDLVKCCDLPYFQFSFICEIWTGPIKCNLILKSDMTENF